MQTNNGLDGIKQYSISELNSIAPDERHAVRDEVFRRHTIATRKMQKLAAELEALEKLTKLVA